MDKVSKVRLKINGVRCFGCSFCRHEVDHAALGHDLREQREKVGVAQREVARAMELSASFISDLEKGRRKWQPTMVERYLAAVNGVNRH